MCNADTDRVQCFIEQLRVLHNSVHQAQLHSICMFRCAHIHKTLVFTYAFVAALSFEGVHVCVCALFFFRWFCVLAWCTHEHLMLTSEALRCSLDSCVTACEWNT